MYFFILDLLYCMLIFKQGLIRYEFIGIFFVQIFFEVNIVFGVINIIRFVRDDVILRVFYIVSFNIIFKDIVLFN